MKSVIDYLREMQNAQTAQATQAAPGAQICRRVPLPEAFELPRRFGLTWGCLQKGVLNGLDAVVAEVRARGVYIRYALPYDGRYMAEYRARKEWLGWGGLSPTLAEALYELAERHEVEVVIEKTQYKTYYYAVVDGVEIDGRFCNGLSPRECVEAVERYVEERRREAVRREVREAVERYLRREYKMLVFESDVEDGFWWDGEFMGKPTSCFITYSKAICDWGGRRWEFIVEHAPDGVYIKPDTPLVDRWIKVAHWETI